MGGMGVDWVPFLKSKAIHLPQDVDCLLSMADHFVGDDIDEPEIYRIESGCTRQNDLI